MSLTSQAPRGVVVVGASLAGVHTAQALRRHGYDGRLTLVGAERHLPYLRPPLSKQFLAGSWERSNIDVRLEADLDATWLLSHEATGLDLRGRTVTVRSQERSTRSLAFDGLIVATGASPRLPRAWPPDRVRTLRTIEDCLQLGSDLRRLPTTVVVGAGLIGSEVAATCRSLGVDVTIVDPLPTPMAGSLGPAAGRVVEAMHRDAGTKLVLGRSVTRVEGGDHVEAVLLDDGARIPADLVVVGLGVIPATGWLEGSGLRLDDGVLCDSHGAALGTGGVVPGVVAAGDVARWDHPVYGSLRVEHWLHAIAQAQCAAATLLEGSQPGGGLDAVPFYWSDLYGHKVQVVGVPHPTDDFVVLEGDPDERRFVAAYGRDGHTSGVLAVDSMNRLNAWRGAVTTRAAFPPPLPP